MVGWLLSTHSIYHPLEQLAGETVRLELVNQFYLLLKWT